MWEHFDKTIPVSASILILVLCAIVVVQAITIAMTWTKTPEPVIVYTYHNEQTEVPNESSEGTFRTLEEEDEL